MKTKGFFPHRVLLFCFAATILWIAHRFDFVGLRGFVQGDLGLILNVPRRILQGEVPYRDFYAGNYTPGSYYFHALLFRLFGLRASVLSAWMALSQMLAVVLVFRLARRVAREALALTLAAATVLLGIPPVNIAFPALDCIVFSLATLEALLCFFEQRKCGWLVLAGSWVGLALAWKISTGLFILAMALWFYLSQCGSRSAWRGFSVLLVVCGFALLKGHRDPLMLLLFVAPLVLLAALPWSISTKYDARDFSWTEGAAFFAPLTFITLIWAVPFLGLLGTQGFWFHFVKFPARQASVLFYPLRFSSWRSVWKIAFFFPVSVSIALFPRVQNWKKENSSMARAMLGFYALHALLNLQIFPQLDQLHLKWSIHGALLLLVTLELLSPRWKRGGISVLVAVLAAMLGFWGLHLQEQWTNGGFRLLAPQRLNLYYPAAQVADFNSVAEFLQSEANRSDQLWNPPGALFNFVLDRPLRLPTDYLGPRYLDDAQVNVLLTHVEMPKPRWLVVPDLPEKDFGWGSLERNYPAIRRYMREHYSATQTYGTYLLFERPSMFQPAAR